MPDFAINTSVKYRDRNWHFLILAPHSQCYVTEISQQDSVQKMNTIFSSGSTQGLPNIVLIEDFRARNFLEVFPEYFVPLTEYINVDDFMDYKIEVSSIDGEQYGMPPTQRLQY